MTNLKLMYSCLLIFLSHGFICDGQEAWTDRTRVLPDLLREVPVAIFITHSPNPNYPEPNKDSSSSDAKYVWKHATSVTAIEKDLQVVRVGSFIWYSEEGWQENVEWRRKDFAQAFNCSKGWLKAGTTYTYEKNYRYGNQTYGGDALWYVLAKDKDGTLYKGIGLIETESEIIKK